LSRRKLGLVVDLIFAPDVREYQSFVVHGTSTEFVHASGSSKRKCAFVAGYDNVVFSAHGGATTPTVKTEKQNKIMLEEEKLSSRLSDCDESTALFTLEPRLILGAKLANHDDGTVAHINVANNVAYVVAAEGYQLRWVYVIFVLVGDHE
jgi:hypothetical protein